MMGISGQGCFFFFVEEQVAKSESSSSYICSSIRVMEEYTLEIFGNYSSRGKFPLWQKISQMQS